MGPRGGNSLETVPGEASRCEGFSGYSTTGNGSACCCAGARVPQYDRGRLPRGHAGRRIPERLNVRFPGGATIAWRTPAGCHGGVAGKPHPFGIRKKSRVLSASKVPGALVPADGQPRRAPALSWPGLLELEGGRVGAAVVEPEAELLAGAGPGLRGFPHVGVGAGVGGCCGRAGGSGSRGCDDGTARTVPSPWPFMR